MMKENRFLPPVKERSLKKTLSYMSGNVLCKACDFLNGVMLIVYIGCELMLPAGDKEDWRMVALKVSAILLWSVAWHFILTYIDEKWRRYVNWMLFYTKEYCDYEDAGEFEAFVDASLKEHMIFRTRRLVLTKDFVLGRLDKYSGFMPVVILRKDVASNSFCEEEHWNWMRKGRGIHTMDGVLELRMKNGNIIKLLVSEGTKNKILRELLAHVKRLT